VIIGRSNPLSSINQGVVPWPGLAAPATTSITPSFPVTGLQATPALLPANWTSVTNVTPVSIPATNAAQFFRIELQ